MVNDACTFWVFFSFFSIALLNYRFLCFIGRKKEKTQRRTRHLIHDAKGLPLPFHAVAWEIDGRKTICWEKWVVEWSHKQQEFHTQMQWIEGVSTTFVLKLPERDFFVIMHLNSNNYLDIISICLYSTLLSSFQSNSFLAAN